MPFAGFPRAGLTFLADLATHNDRIWFTAQRHIYQTQLLVPAQAFVLALGERLAAFAPGIHGDPRTNGRGTLMRLARDTRFSVDKTPYKTELSGLFWDGMGEKTASPAFGFRLQSDGMDLMAGLFQFAPAVLLHYRGAVIDPQAGATLTQILSDLERQPGYRIEGEQYRRVPAGYDPTHPRADLLRAKGLAVSPPQLPVDLVCSPQLIDVCAAHFAAMAPLQQWLTRACASASTSP